MNPDDDTVRVNDDRRRLAVSALLEIAGLLAIAAGLWMLAPWLGVTVGGVGLAAYGIALDPPKRGRS